MILLSCLQQTTTNNINDGPSVVRTTRVTSKQIQAPSCWGMLNLNMRTVADVRPKWNPSCIILIPIQEKMIRKILFSGRQPYAFYWRTVNCCVEKRALSVITTPPSTTLQSLLPYHSWQSTSLARLYLKACFIDHDGSSTKSGFRACYCSFMCSILGMPYGLWWKQNEGHSRILGQWWVLRLSTWCLGWTQYRCLFGIDHWRMGWFVGYHGTKVCNVSLVRSLGSLGCNTHSSNISSFFLIVNFWKSVQSCSTQLTLFLYSTTTHF